MHGKTSNARLRFYFWVGVTLLLFAVITWFALDVMSAREQAHTPGEKNYGVAVLGLLLPVILVLGAGGVSFLVVSSAALAYRKIAPKNSTGADSNLESN